MNCRITLLTLCLVAACSGDITPPVVEPPPLPTAMPAGVYELAGVGTSLTTDDLQPLKEIIGNARFVALGESTHTSGGYYAMKARIVRFMVEEMGFRAVAWESPWLEAETARRYGSGPDAALSAVWRAPWLAS